MTTELFLGSLTILTLAGIIIIALTTNDRVSRPKNSNRNSGQADRQSRSNSDR